MELTIAEFACASDFSCISVVDDGCDKHGPFHLCRELEDTSGENMLRCSTYQGKEGKKILVVHFSTNLNSTKILIFTVFCLFTVRKNFSKWKCQKDI